MTSITRKLSIVAVFAAAALLVAAGTAVATRTINVPSQVSIKSEGLHFSGHVTTAANGKPCREQRRVILYRAFAKAPDQPLARDTTGPNGAWSITLQGSAGISFGRFYAKVKKRSDGAAGTIHVCLSDRSKVIGVNP